MTPDQQDEITPLYVAMAEAVSGHTDDFDAHLAYEDLTRRPNRTRTNRHKVERFPQDDR